MFPPVTYTCFKIQLAQWERGGLRTDLNGYPLGSEMEVPGYLFFVFLAVQIAFFPTIAGLLQRLLFGINSGSCKMLNEGDNADVAIKLDNVSKQYRSYLISRLLGSNKVVKAVDNLTLRAQRGQVIVLLGANGSGKSTTLAAISGTHSVSSGHIGLDRTCGLGFCPQRNVLWDKHTVLEHVRIFNGLKCKSTPDKSTQIEALIESCDLKHKSKSTASILSGGQERKFQLVMAFTRGSQLCCVDEVSSGLDPLSRKIIWDILLAERRRRTLLLTTHALDEADGLADDIAIMSKGRLIAQESSVQLKNAHGGGYRVTTSVGNVTSSWLESGRISSTDGAFVYQMPDSVTTCRIMYDMQQ